MLLMAATVPHSPAGHNPTYVLTVSPHQGVTFDIERLFEAKDAHQKLDSPHYHSERASGL